MSNVENVTELRLDEMRQKYYSIRREVFAQSTSPKTPRANRHLVNQRLFREQVERICAGANLNLYSTTTPTSKALVWNHLWTKIKYAGIRAQAASNEIKGIEPFFRDYLALRGKDWSLRIEWQPKLRRYRILEEGASSSDFRNRRGVFRGVQTNGKLTKLCMTVITARRFAEYFEKNPDAPALDFITQRTPPADIWKIHESLMEKGYRSHLTCCHLLMDLGFEVIKPDIVVTRLFLLWGWLHEAISDLPSDLSELDLVGKGKYGVRYLYYSPQMYRPVIDLARRIVAQLDPIELQRGVGWTTKNPLREFDLFVVKSGQEPDAAFGIERVLFRSERLVSARIRCRHCS